MSNEVSNFSLVSLLEVLLDQAIVIGVISWNGQFTSDAEINMNQVVNIYFHHLYKSKSMKETHIGYFTLIHER